MLSGMCPGKLRDVGSERELPVENQVRYRLHGQETVADRSGPNLRMQSVDKVRWPLVFRLAGSSDEGLLQSPEISGRLDLVVTTLVPETPESRHRDFMYPHWTSCLGTEPRSKFVLLGKRLVFPTW